MQAEGHGDVAAAHHGHHLLHIGQPPDVGELVHEHDDRRGQRPAVALDGALAEDVHGLPHHDGEEERVEGGRVRHDGEDGAPLALVAEAVQLHLVAAHELAHLGYREGLHARVAGHEDGLQGLAGGVLEHLVVEEAEVGVHGGGLGHAHPSVRRRAGPVGDAAGGVEGLAVRTLAPHVAHARLHLLEEEVERASVVLVRFLGLGEREQRHKAREGPVGGRAVVDEVSDERYVEQALGILPEGIARVLLVACGVVDEAGDELKDVRLVLDVRDGVVVEGHREVHGVEGEHLVPGGIEHVPEARKRLSLGVGHEVVRRHLHDVGLEEPARLAGARAAHDEHVAVAFVAPVVVGAAHGHPEVLREDDVVEGILDVHESTAASHGAPAGGSVLLALALRRPMGEGPRPCAPDRAGGHKPRRERGSLEREGAVACEIGGKMY